MLNLPFSLSFLYTIRETGQSERAVRFPVFGEMGGSGDRTDIKMSNLRVIDADWAPAPPRMGLIQRVRRLFRGDGV